MHQVVERDAFVLLFRSMVWQNKHPFENQETFSTVPFDVYERL